MLKGKLWPTISTLAFMPASRFAFTRTHRYVPECTGIGIRALVYSLVAGVRIHNSLLVKALRTIFGANEVGLGLAFVFARLAPKNTDYLMRAVKPRLYEGYEPEPLQAAILPLGLIRMLVTAAS